MNSYSRLAGLLSATAACALGQTVHPVANMFRPQATPADSVYNVSMLMLAICAAIFLVVGGFLAFTIVRFRRRRRDDGREPAQVYGSNRIEVAWTVIPILIVLVLSMRRRAPSWRYRTSECRRTRLRSPSWGTSGGGNSGIRRTNSTSR
jgi:heme/copper-type cytochrome/quinol oxidase subunit 2